MRVRGADAQQALAIATVAGIGAALADVSPTGSTVVDFLLVLLASVACIWAAASAPWWAGAALAAIAAALAPSLELLLMASTAAVGGLAIGSAKRAVPWSRALVAAVALQVLARLGNIERFGFSAFIALGTLSLVAFLGIRRRPRRDRKVMWWVVGVVGGFSVLTAVGLAYAANSSRSDLETGTSAAEDAIDLLSAGDFLAARAQFTRAAEAFDRVDQSLSRPWAQASRLVPVVAQHRRAAAHLVRDARDVSELASALLTRVNLDSLRVVNGRIDVPQVQAVEQPLLDLQAAIDELGDTIADIDSPWLVSPLRTRLVALSDDIVDQQDRGRDVLAIVHNAPALLGADRPRVYFIAFTTPVEARGLGGFMGNWAEITLTDGQISLSRFGRTTDLNQAGAPDKQLSGPTELLDNYGQYLLADDEGQQADGTVWSEITVSPNFPDVATAMAELYPQSGGRTVDGVFVMDVDTIARLMEISGPVITTEGIEVSSQNAVQFLLYDQYRLSDEVARVDLLEEVARSTVTRLLSSELPSPPDLADLLGPMVSQGRLLGWASSPDEQAVFDQIGMSGSLPDHGVDAIGVAFNNVASNKIDGYLEAGIDYDVQTDASANLATATMTVTLTNTSPTTGLPAVVIGNERGYPVGTNEMLLSIYSVMPFTSATLDGQAFDLSVGDEGGLLLSSGLVKLSAGQTRVVTLQLEGSLDLRNGYQLEVRTPPSATLVPTTLQLNGTVVPVQITEPGIHQIGVP